MFLFLICLAWVTEQLAKIPTSDVQGFVSPMHIVPKCGQGDHKAIVSTR